MKTTSASTSSMVSTKGAAPMNTSPSLMRSSARLVFIMKQAMPRGGVSRPISTAMMVTMPNQIKSTSNAFITGRMSGTMMKMMDGESRIVPIRMMITR